MTKRNDIKEELQKEEDEVYGDETISGSSPRPETDDDVDEIMTDVTGEKVNRGNTVADEVSNEEEERHGLEPEERKEKEIPHLE